MKLTKIFVAAVVVVMVGVVAAIAVSQRDTKSVETSDAPASAKSTDAVDIKGFAFTPGDITVKAGAAVTWTNRDSVKHNVVVDSGEGPDGPLLAKGETYSYTFDKPGTYPYHCDPHRSMTGTVYVTE